MVMFFYVPNFEIETPNRDGILGRELCEVEHVRFAQIMNHQVIAERNKSAITIFILIGIYK